MMRCVIIANGEIGDVSFIKKNIRQDDYVICLDGAVKYAKAAGIRPDLIVGDFDSADKTILGEYKAQGIEISSFPERKDYTDMEIGIITAVRKGFDELAVFACLGGRMDHTLANIDNLVQAAENGIDAYILDEKQHIYIIGGERELCYKEGTVLSLIPFDKEVVGVTTENLSYPLKSETLVKGYSRGVSNVFLKNNAKIFVDCGYLLAIINVEAEEK